MVRAPADEAVVTRTVASPNTREIAPSRWSTVCTRDIGAIRRSRAHQPVCV